MKELHTSELVEVSGGKFHISAQGGGNLGKKIWLLLVNWCFLFPNNSGVEFSVSKQFGYVQGLGVQFRNLLWFSKNGKIFVLSFLTLINLCSLSACNSHFTGNINPLGTHNKVANPNCANSANSHIRQPSSKTMIQLNIVLGYSICMIANNE
ncbi:putative bacteriocin/pheromone [Neisseria gonorrhoeae]|uniref:Putative bacteriocin/pheromone n=1 Tax=Neisseria gonorrhoeae TaxID=485 RepID=A0A379B1C3_NEIGO|nr:putative bacteriocin/pheromone [Neisseria gonorrhoeae]